MTYTPPVDVGNYNPLSQLNEYSLPDLIAWYIAHGLYVDPVFKAAQCPTC
jgi:hypothetical protein